MFDLEKAVDGWRDQLRAAGIGCSATVRELEAHLRDELDRQGAAGVPPECAFFAAARQMGDPVTLGREFGRLEISNYGWSRLGSVVVFCVNSALGLVLLAGGVFAISGVFGTLWHRVQFATPDAVYLGLNWTLDFYGAFCGLLGVAAAWRMVRGLPTGLAWMRLFALLLLMDVGATGLLQMAHWGIRGRALAVTVLFAVYPLLLLQFTPGKRKGAGDGLDRDARAA